MARGQRFLMAGDYYARRDEEIAAQVFPGAEIQRYSRFPANDRVSLGARQPQPIHVPQGWRMGVDISQLQSADGSPPKVEWLPLTGAAGTDIAAGLTADFELKPLRYARPGVLVMDDDIAKNLVMTSLQIGGKNVFVAGGAVPCRFFSHACVHTALSSWVAHNGAPITFTLRNIHASATQTVRGIWLCDTVEAPTPV